MPEKPTHSIYLLATRVEVAGTILLGYVSDLASSHRRTQKPQKRSSRSCTRDDPASALALRSRA